MRVDPLVNDNSFRRVKDYDPSMSVSTLSWILRFMSMFECAICENMEQIREFVEEIRRRIYHSPFVTSKYRVEELN